MGVTMCAAVTALKKDWNSCLAKSGGEPAKCERKEKELRTAAQSAGVDCCINDTIKLMQCTQGSTRSAGCAAEFIAMRECNRAGGKQFVSEGSAYAIAPGKASLFVPSAAGLLSTAAPPLRTLEGMLDFGKEYAQSLGIMPDQVRF